MTTEGFRQQSIFTINHVLRRHPSIGIEALSILSFVSGRGNVTYTEVAEYFKMNEVTARVHLHRLKKKRYMKVMARGKYALAYEGKQIVRELTDG